ncbi:kinase-like protein [Cristinia sonorae]|uniref:Kinase-like protein n=1 Tax=Cristinia sonorae TaxID=1940300 RepID=A0A8K0XJV7_9AGAR|nr:kinase-like protein [Cristinia sonorae]
MLSAFALRFIYRARCWYERVWLGRPNRSLVRYLPFDFVIKANSNRGAHEADVLRYIRSHTTIPVPRVYWSAQDSDSTYTLMKRVDGSILEARWPRFDDIQRTRIVAQLRAYVGQLRDLQPTHSNSLAVCGLGNTPCNDGRVSSMPFGPFDDEAGFNDHLIRAAELYLADEILNDIRASMTDDHRICFTHGDLTPRNIIVRDDGTIAAVIDWEYAGWYPEYWETVKALYCTMVVKDDRWDKAVRDFIPGNYERELQIDKSLSDRMVGAF